MPELRNRQREIAGTLYAPGTTPATVLVVERASPIHIATTELEQRDCDLLTGIRQSTVVPIDHTERAADRATEVFRPQVAVARAEIPGRLDQILESDQLVEHGCQVGCERSAGSCELFGQPLPPSPADGSGVPGILWTPAGEPNAVDRRKEPGHV